MACEGGLNRRTMNPAAREAAGRALFEQLAHKDTQDMLPWDQLGRRKALFTDVAGVVVAAYHRTVTTTDPPIGGTP